MIRTRRWMFAGALALAGCGADGPDRPDAAAGSTVRADPPAEPAGTDAVDAVAASPGGAAAEADQQGAIDAAVDVRAAGCGPRVGFGTGSVIATRTIATAAHVVAGAETVELIDGDGDRIAGDVVLFDADLDLAVIRSASPIGTPLAPRTADAERGETGIVVLPREIDGSMVVDVVEVTVAREAVINTTDIYREESVTRDGFEVEGSIDPGDSGAMVVLPGGGAGIVWARSNVDERRAWAIDLPAELIDGTAAELTTPVDVGPCTR